MLCSRCRRPERENSADLTAKRLPEEVPAARETVAVAPRPMTGPRSQSAAAIEKHLLCVGLRSSNELAT